MILFDEDIKEVKKIVYGLRIQSIINNDSNVKEFTDKLIYIIERYQDMSLDNTWHDKHERKAYSFMMRFAERLRDKKISNECKSAFFENEFLELLDDYPSLEQRFKERLRGDN